MKKYLISILIGLIFAGILTAGSVKADTLGTLSQWLYNQTTKILTPRNSNSIVQVPSLGSVTSPCLKISDINGTFATTTCITSAMATTTINGFIGPAFTFATTSDTGINFNITGAGSTLTFSPQLQSGYSIPLTASTTNWNSFYNTPSTRITAGTNLSWSGNTLNGLASSTILGLLSGTAPISYNSGTGAIGLITPLAMSYGGTATTTSFSSGSVLFSNGTSFAQDNANLNYNAGSLLLTTPRIGATYSAENTNNAIYGAKTVTQINGGQNYIAGYFPMTVNSTNHTDNGYAVGAAYDVLYNGSGSSSYSTGEARALVPSIYNTGTTNIANAAALIAGIGNTNSGTITNAIGFKSASYSPGGGAITNYYGFYNQDSSAVNDWAFYGSGVAKSYFGGNVGIGATPDTNLSVYGGASKIEIGGFYGGGYNGISLNGSTSSGDYNLLSSASDKTLYINRPTSYGMNFRYGNADQMILTTTGKLGIGITPDQMLTVAGNIRMQGGRSILYYDGDSSAGRGGLSILGDPSQHYMLFTPTDNSGNSIDGTLRYGGFGNYNSNIVNVAYSGKLSIGIKDAAAAFHLYDTSGAVTAEVLQGAGANENFSTQSKILFRSGIDGTGFAIAKVVGSRDGGSGYNSYLGFYTSTANATSTDQSTEKMRIDNAGNVGIGTKSPGTKLHVIGDSAAAASSLGGGFRVDSNDNSNPLALIAYMYGTGMQTTPSWAWQVDHVGVAYGNLGLQPNGGFVGVGTSDPNAPLTVVGSGGTNGDNAIRVTTGGSLSTYWQMGRNYANGAFDLYSSQYGGILLTGTIGGNIGIATTTPANTLDVNGGVDAGGGSANHATCWKANGRTLGYCSTAPNASGVCTCN